MTLSGLLKCSFGIAAKWHKVLISVQEMRTLPPEQETALHFCSEQFSDKNVRNMVIMIPTLHTYISPLSHIMKKQKGPLQSSPSLPSAILQFEAVYGLAEEVEVEILAGDYQVLKEGGVQEQFARGPLQNGRLGLETYLQLSTLQLVGCLPVVSGGLDLGGF